MATQKQIDFVKMVYPAAKRLYGEKPNDSIHPIFETAQAALERGWSLEGKLPNNLFGITKGSLWTGKTQLVVTTEYFTRSNVTFKAPEKVINVTGPLTNGNYKYTVARLFRVYDTLEDCLYDHQALFRKSGYADAWPYRNDPREFVKRLMDETGWKYATGPEYVKTMLSIISTVERIVKKEGL